MSYQSLYDAALQDPQSFWAQQAAQISWFHTPPTGLTRDEEGLYRWFKGGKMNTCYLAVDYHVEQGRGEKIAYIYDSPVTNTKKQYTYKQVQHEVACFAGVLHKLGVRKGDRVIIYMPMMPEVAFAMLACARLGAVHSVVFGGFAANELAIRIDDATPKLILMASGGIEIEKIIPYKPIVDKALTLSKHQPDHLVVLQRPFVPAQMQAGRDLDWNTMLYKIKKQPCVEVDAIDPLYILYTSGTTGKPKGIIRDNGGHAVALKFSMKHIFGVDTGDVYWAASDVGWVVGHSYIVYGPLIHGCTSIIYEGKPIKTPDSGSFWRVISEYKVKTFFTAPTAIRAIKKEDSNGLLLKKYDLSSLKYQFLAGERCDVATLDWLTDLLKIPVIDHWWQTESGWPMLANMVGVELLPIKPGSAGKCVPTYNVQILDENNEQLEANQEGAVAIKLPLPPGVLPTLWNDTPRFIDSYLTAYPGYYFTGDGGYKDEDGYVFITGRIDDVINVAGHRLSTAAMEEIVAGHPAVAECAVIGIEEEMKGQIPVGFVVLKGGVDISDAQLEKELMLMVRNSIGAVAAFRRAVVAKRLPKTRSGKILRKIMRAMTDGKSFSPPSTIEDITVLDELKVLMTEHKIGIAFS
ncbi:MAG: propionyl-CoA synthetase [Bacteroidota bacterium]